MRNGIVQFNSRLFCFTLVVFFSGWLAAECLTAAEATGTKQSTALYTEPDHNLDNGFKGKITSPDKPIQQIFASSTTDYKKLYKGKIGGEDNQMFIFKGLPIGKYDLVILYDNTFYEGLTLNRKPNSTLTEENISSIKEIINKSTPFFNEKQINRIKGARHQHKARCVFQELRTRTITMHSGEGRDDIQIRSVKLGLLKDTGVGWALMETREIVRQEVVKATDHTGLLKHEYNHALQNIRTIGSMKNLGKIDLTK